MHVKARTVFVILALIYSLGLDVPIQAQSKDERKGTAAISGRVITRGGPARDVTVLLREPGPGSSNSRRVGTDEYGRFRFSGIIGGNYSISALAPGHISPGDDDGFMSGKGQRLSISAGEKVENIILEIRPGAVISGRISDSQGRPAIEEMVSLRRLDKNGNFKIYQIDSPYNEFLRTDERGDYRIFGLPEGRYLVSVGRDQSGRSVAQASSGIYYPRVYYPNARSEAEAKVVEVIEGAEATDIDITVTDPVRTYNVYGRVKNAETGQPVSGVELWVGPINQDGNLSGASETGDYSKPNGEFRFTVVAPGRYFLTPITDRGDPMEMIGEPIMFDVGEGDTAGIEAIVRRGASISGELIIEGVNDPKILSKLSQVTLIGNYRSNISNNGLPIIPRFSSMKVYADGRFRIGGLQAGKVSIDAMQSPNTRGLTVSRIEHNGMALNEIEVGASEQLTGVRVILSHSTYTLRGELKFVGGEPPAGFRFTAVARNVDQPMKSPPGVAVDERGRFVFENLAEGEYQINVIPSRLPQGERLDLEFFKLISSFKASAVVTDASSQTVNLVIDLARKEGPR